MRLRVDQMQLQEIAGKNYTWKVVQKFLYDVGARTLYTAPDGSKKCTPVVVNRDGHESEFNVLDPEGIPNNVSFQLFHETS